MDSTVRNFCCFLKPDIQICKIWIQILGYSLLAGIEVSNKGRLQSIKGKKEKGVSS